MRYRSIRGFFVFVFAMACASGAVAGVNSWTLHGPAGGGGATGQLAVHPTDASIVLTANTRGIFRSSNGGQSWTLVNDELLNWATSLEFDPTNANRVMACDGYIYISEDAGQTFALSQGPLAPNSLARASYGPDGTLYAVSNGGRLWKAVEPYSTWVEITDLPWENSYPQMLEVDPEDAQTLYVALQDVGLYRSVNGGDDWTLVTGITVPTYFYNIAFDPENSSRLLVSTGGGIYLSTNGGSSWTLRQSGSAYWVGFEPGTQRVAALQLNGVSLSDDNGVSWQPGATLSVTNVFAGGFAPGVPGRLLLSTSNGILISDDGGVSAEYHVAGLAGVSPREPVSSDDGTVLIGMNSGDDILFRRQGGSYVPLSTQLLLSQLTGIRQIWQLAIAPGNSQRIFAVSWGNQLLRTTDGGVNWSAPHPTFLLTAGDYITDIQIDPSDPLVAYVTRSSSGVWKTLNGGNTYDDLDPPFNFGAAIGISPHDSDTLYAAGGDTYGDAIYKSTNGGETWVRQLPPTGLNLFMSFAFHPTDANVVYAAGWSGVWKTTNGGSTWTHMMFPPSDDTHVVASAVLFDPLVPSTLFIAGTRDSAGIMRSVDDGATWEIVPLEDVTTQFIGAVLDPANPAVLIGATNGHDIAEYQVSPDLSLSMSGLGDTLPTSGSATAIYTITNAGPHASSASELSITVPAWLTPSGPGNCSATGQTLRCQFGVLRVGESINVEVTFAVGAAAVASVISATLEGHELDVSAGNNTVAHNVTGAELADIDVAIAAASQAIDRGTSTTVTVTVSNAGPSPSTATELQLELPANLSAANVAAAQGTCTTSAATIACDLGSVAPDATTTVTLTLTGDAVGPGSLLASVEGAGVDTDDAHTAALEITVRPVANLGVTLTDSADPVVRGGTIQYVATVLNNGPDSGGMTTSLTITGAQVTAATVAGGSCQTTAATATCTVASLDSGASAAVTVTVSANTVGTVTAEAAVTFSGTDTEAGNNTASATTTVSAPPASSSSSGGGGGGGSLDWILVGLLGLLVALRWRSLAPPSARRRC